MWYPSLQAVFATATAIIAAAALVAVPANAAVDTLVLGDAVPAFDLLIEYADECFLFLPSSKGFYFEHVQGNGLDFKTCARAGTCKCKRLVPCANDDCLQARPCETEDGLPHPRCLARQPCNPYLEHLRTVYWLFLECNGAPVPARTDAELLALGAAWKTSLLAHCLIDKELCRYGGDVPGTLQPVDDFTAASLASSPRDVERVQQCIQQLGPIPVLDCTVWNVTTPSPMSTTGPRHTFTSPTASSTRTLRPSLSTSLVSTTPHPTSATATTSSFSTTPPRTTTVTLETTSSSVACDIAPIDLDCTDADSRAAVAALEACGVDNVVSCCCAPSQDLQAVGNNVFIPLNVIQVALGSIRWVGGSIEVESHFFYQPSLSYLDVGSLTYLGGSLSLRSTKIVDLDFAGVTEVGGSVDFGFSRVQSVNFRNLKRIGGSLNFAYSRIGAIDLRNIQSIGGGFDFGDSYVTSVDFGQLTSIGGTAFFAFTGLNFLSLGPLEVIGSDLVMEYNSLTSVDLGALHTVAGTLYLGGNQLTTVDLSGLRNVTGTIILQDNLLTEVDCHGLDVCVETDPAVTKINCPSVC